MTIDKFFVSFFITISALATIRHTSSSLCFFFFSRYLIIFALNYISENRHFQLILQWHILPIILKQSCRRKKSLFLGTAVFDHKIFIRKESNISNTSCLFKQKKQLINFESIPFFSILMPMLTYNECVLYIESVSNIFGCI